jgi:glycosyltransferase involved in cell wall biosynthesis
MDKPFIISDFGEKEAHKAGVSKAKHIIIGVDQESWKMPNKEEKKKFRDFIGLEDDEKMVLTVGDNQERKNFSRAMDIIADVRKDVKLKYVMVTREHNPFGWKLRDYAHEIGINNDLVIFERGIDFQRLWTLYASADAFLLTSKGEGLGMPVIEAMSVGVPVVATNCTAIRDHLKDGRGYLIDATNEDHLDYDYRDPFGNGRRYFAKRSDGAEKLKLALTEDNTELIQKAKNYVVNRKWEDAVDQLESTLKEITDEEN